MPSCGLAVLAKGVPPEIPTPTGGGLAAKQSIAHYAPAKLELNIICTAEAIYCRTSPPIAPMQIGKVSELPRQKNSDNADVSQDRATHPICDVPKPPPKRSHSVQYDVYRSPSFTERWNRK